jgi:type II secretory pathway pseudopilin PulG
MTGLDWLTRWRRRSGPSSTGRSTSSPLARQAGLSLVETVIVLSVMTAVTGILAPAGMTLVQEAREVQVQRDCASLRDAVIKLLLDTNQASLRLQQGHGATVDMLVSSGEAPGIDTGGDPRWSRTPDGSGLVDLLDHYLVDNTPAGNPANAWPAPTGIDRAGWRGAYLRTAPGADPWGHRYAVNVRYLNTRNDVIVVSAGPNGVVETPFTGRGLLPAGDDRLVLIR